VLRTAPTWLKALLLGQLVSAAGSLAWLYLTLYLVNDRGLSAPGAIIVLLEPRVARRLASRPALQVIGAGYAVVGVGWLVLGAVRSVLSAFAAVLVISVGEMLYKPTATAHAADLAPAGMQRRYQSLYASASIGGILLSPLLGTTLYGAAPRLVWPCATVVAFAAAAAISRGRRSDLQRAAGDGDVPTTKKKEMHEKNSKT